LRLSLTPRRSPTHGLSLRRLIAGRALGREGRQDLLFQPLRPRWNERLITFLGGLHTGVAKELARS
jgi:hypothetical protein